MTTLSNNKHWIVIGTIAAGALLTWVCPRIAQSYSYHDLADKRTVFGIQNFGDVISNLPFAAVGAYGLWHLAQNRKNMDRQQFTLWTTYSLCCIFTCFASGFYHIMVDLRHNDRFNNHTYLLGDRLSMMVTGMSFLCIVIADWINLRLGYYLLGPLLTSGVLGTLHWWYTEYMKRGDLRLYGVMLNGNLLLVPLICWLYKNDRRISTGRYDPNTLVYFGLVWFVLARAMEMSDKVVYFLTMHLISGHTLKHLFAAVAMGVILMLRTMQGQKGGQGTVRTTQKRFA